MRGDASCPELVSTVHCRNCPTHSAAAAALLRRPLPVGYVADWTSHFARRQEVEDPAHGIGHDLPPRRRMVGAADLGLRGDRGDGRHPFATAPALRPVLGLVNVRGELLICFSLTNLLGGDEPTQPTREKSGADRRRLLVVKRDGRRIAFPVDEVHGIHRYDPQPAGGAGDHRQGRDELHQGNAGVAGPGGRAARRRRDLPRLGSRYRMTGQDLSQLSMLDLFRAEAENQVQALTAGLLGARAQPDLGRAARGCMRAAHSLKGAARIIDLDPGVDAGPCHGRHFVAAQRAGSRCARSDIDLLLRGVDLMTSLAGTQEAERALTAERSQDIAAFTTALQRTTQEAMRRARGGRGPRPGRQRQTTRWRRRRSCADLPPRPSPPAQRRRERRPQSPGQRRKPDPSPRPRRRSR